MDKSQNQKIIIVHDAFVVKGGAERLALFLSNIFPDAPIVTSIYNPQTSYPELKQKKIYTHKLNGLIKHEKLFKQLFPIWFLYFFQKKFQNFDVVISSSTYLAKFISPTNSTKHFCYLHSPFRFLWNRSSYSIESLPFKAPLVKIIDNALPGLRKIDYRLTQRIDQLITNSKNMSNFIHKTYERKAEIIHPPIDIQQYSLGDPSDFYLCVSRLLSYKKIDIAIKACNQLNRKLIIIGDGLERNNLEKIAGSTIRFLGNVDETTLKKYYATCKALILPGIEDFGMVPVEVQASGRPVIAFKAGGALETIVEGESGLFFNNQSVDDVIHVIEDFERMEFSPEYIRSSVLRFDFKVFKQKILSIIKE